MSFRTVRLGFRAFAAAFLLTATATWAQSPVLGSGRGVDHVTILSKSLVRLSRTYADLGFTIYPYGSDEGGFENSVVYFPDETYLELYGIHDIAAVAKSSEPHAATAPEGLTWLTLHTSSADRTATHLRGRGHKLFGPDTIKGSTGEWSYKLTGLETDALPGAKVYFIEYNEPVLNASRQRRIDMMRARETHRNGAQGLHAVWVGVKSLADAEKAYRDAGFAVGERFALRALAASAREIRTGGRALLLVEPSTPESPVRQLLGSRTAAFIGYSVNVVELQQTRSVLTERDLPVAPDYQGRFGRSILIPPEQAGAAWLEFFERPAAEPRPSRR
ncbi:VOC family protein [Phenylobacterium terrae]|uniref:VOC family protein n=1 Tax=Phenylobacterium terrae TaxID=2665495 RepID=A0ABW4MYK6_9CAUL